LKNLIGDNVFITHVTPSINICHYLQHLIVGYTLFFSGNPMFLKYIMSTQAKQKQRVQQAADIIILNALLTNI